MFNVHKMFHTCTMHIPAQLRCVHIMSGLQASVGHPVSGTAECCNMHLCASVPAAVYVVQESSPGVAPHPLLMVGGPH